MFSVILRRFRVPFSLSAEILGAAIIAHGTRTGDVTYGLLLAAQIAINPFHCSLQFNETNSEKIALVEFLWTNCNEMICIYVGILQHS